MPYPVDEARIAAAEVALGRRLPAWLRKRLAEDNGGELVSGEEVFQLYAVWDDSSPRTVRKTANHLVREQATWRGWERFPAGAIAIGEDGSGDALVLLAGEDEARRWVHETGECEVLAEK
jgi:SMI1 / KNR4 family (SUKH-1)